MFDPAVHQAVASEPSEQYPEGAVTAELQRGYQMHDRVLRPSLVKVAQNS
jgi:molecular chaperone GrpE